MKNPIEYTLALSDGGEIEYAFFLNDGRAIEVVPKTEYLCDKERAKKSRQAIDKDNSGGVTAPRTYVGRFVLKTVKRTVIIADDGFKEVKSDVEVELPVFDNVSLFYCTYDGGRAIGYIKHGYTVDLDAIKGCDAFVKRRVSFSTVDYDCFKDLYNHVKIVGNASRDGATVISWMPTDRIED